MPVQSVTVGIALPFGLGNISGVWAPDETQRDASWEMYVELVTRISVARLGADEGLISESLSSLYSLFGTTREILRKYGPGVAKVPRRANQSFGSIALAILNRVLRPVLAKWHPLLLDHEAARPDGVSQADWERSWSRSQEIRDVLDNVRGTLVQYADLLATVADISPIHDSADSAAADA
jgi:hypothetical protein